MSRAALVLVCCTSFMGCIIRDPNYSPRRNTPPVVLEDPEQPFADWINVDLRIEGMPDGGVGNPEGIVATVRDPDVEQDLQGLIFVDYDPNATRNTAISNEFSITQTGTNTRSVRQFIDFTAFPFTRGCHVVELHVSEEFVNVTNPEPREAGDLGRGIWFVRVLDGSEDVIDLRGCRNPSERDAGP